MTWSRAFPEPFILADGRKMMERLMAAAEDPSAEALDRAARQVSVALHAEGLAPIRAPRKRRGR
jgi:hypothetical protein